MELIFKIFSVNGLITIVLLLLVAVLVTISRSLSHWQRLGVYAVPPSLLFGNAKSLILQQKFVGLEFKEFYDKLKQKGLKYGGYYFLTKPIFVPVELDLVKQIMTQDFASFTDHVHYINAETEPLTADLSSLKGLRWKQLRSKLTPAFTSGKMKMMFQTLLECTEELTSLVNKAVEEDSILDIKEIIGRFTTDVIGSCAFGLDCNSLKNPKSEFRKYGQKYFYTSPWYSLIKLLLFLYPELLSYIKIRTIERDVHDFFTNIVNQTVEFREKNKIIRKDFMHILIQLKNNVDTNNYEEELIETGRFSGKETSITMEELAAQCFFFFVAGFETSSTASTFLLYELAQNSEIQETLRNEIGLVLSNHQDKITYEAIMEMPYLEKCIQETLRKYPPISIHTRECTKTYKVPHSNLILKKGSAVFIPVLGIQRDSEYYPNPDEFDPERFSEDNKAARHSSAWTPFGDGPRTCIAMRFGIMQTKVGVVALLRNHRFVLNSKTPTPLVMDPKMPLVLSAEEGIWLNAEKLDSI